MSSLKIKWEEVKLGVIEVRHNKRKGLKLRIKRNSESMFNCYRCAIYSQYTCNLCFKVDKTGHTYFERDNKNTRGRDNNTSE